jgi:hypothetical protein
MNMTESLAKLADMIRQVCTAVVDVHAWLVLVYHTAIDISQQNKPLRMHMSTRSHRPDVTHEGLRGG